MDTSVLASVIPALKVKFGKIEYFVSYMHVSDIVNKVKFPSELKGWENLSIEERYQRAINIRRVKRDIAPYFALDDARFSGSLVLAIMGNDEVTFEPAESFLNIPKLYKAAARDMGFLILSGNEQLIPLDGQHRVKALQYAMTGNDEKQAPIAGLKANEDLAKDQVSVILIRFEPTLARRIFSKINRYAKPTTRADNLITDDDDSMAVITRNLLGSDGVIPSKLVRLTGNTLSGSAPHFTTLATFYNANQELFKILCATGIDTPSKMTADQIDIHLDEMRKEWQGLLSGVDLWKKAIEDPDVGGDATRQDIREQTLLGKPVGQLALIGGYVLRLQQKDKIDRKTLCHRINRIDWGVDNDMWKEVLINPNGRVMSGKTTVRNAAEFIAYLLGAHIDRKQRQRLSEKIYGNPTHKLPKPILNV